MTWAEAVRLMRARRIVRRGRSRPITLRRVQTADGTLAEVIVCAGPWPFSGHPTRVTAAARRRRDWVECVMEVA